MIKKKILIATGGTGGHIFPALSLAKNLVKNNYSVKLTTDNRGLKYLGNENKLNLIKLNTYPLIQKNIFKIILSSTRIFFSIIRSIILLLMEKPNIIFGMGGYSSFPICFAAAILKIKFIIYENNLIIGKANKFLLPFAKKIFVSYKELEGISEKDKEKMTEIGNIIREEIINSNFSITPKNNYDKINILVLGGSQAAKIFAEKLPVIFKKLNDSGAPIKIFQQCQPNQNYELLQFYKKAKIDCELFNFSPQIMDYYSKVNLVITRSGASVLGELINTRTPFIAIPLPLSADNHQLKNALYYEKRGFGYSLEEKNISERLFKLINLIISDKKTIQKIIYAQSQYSDKEIFKKVNINLEKILNEKN